MPDVVSWVVLALLVLAVVGSVVPMLPSGLVALLGIYTAYVFGDGMHVLLLASFTVVGLLAVAVDWFGPAIATRARGAEGRTAVVASVVGFALFFVAGPVGIVVGIFATILLAELHQDKPADQAWDNALWGTAGLLASGAAVFALVLSMLVGYVVFVLWLGL